MNQNRLEIKILKDTNNAHIDINAMSLRASQALVTLLDSLTKIIELTPDHKNIKIQITSGSAIIAAEGEKIAKTKSELEKIFENKSTNKELVEQWRRIQTVFCSNGLQYDASFYEKGKKTSFSQELLTRQKLRVKPTKRKTYNTGIEFITGKLMSVGGKNPNIHVEVEGKVMPPIGCTETNASKAKTYLYQTIRFCAWVNENSGIKHYTLCDSYFQENIYEELNEFTTAFFAEEEIEALKKLHYQIRQYLDKGQYGEMRKLLRLFIHESTDINILKMILIVTQSVKEHEKLKLQIEAIQNLFDKRYKQLYKKIKPQ